MWIIASSRACALAAAVLWLLPAPARGQRSGPSSTPTTGGTSSGNTGGGRTGTGTGNPPPPDTTTPNANTQPNPRTTQPIFITGRVMMDDGSELPQNVAIERLCGNLPRIEGHVDSRGYFSIQLGVTGPDALQDASTSSFDLGPNGGGTSGNNTSQQMLLNCELRANAPGYQSQRVNLSTHQRFDNPDIGTILLHRLTGSEGTTVSATTLAAPKQARKAFRKGIELEKKKDKTDEALASFQQAVDLYPKYAEAWYELGRAQSTQGQREAARHSFDESVRADPAYVPPYIQISILELAAQHWQALADVTDKAVHLDSFSFPQAFFLNAVANYSLNRMDAAEKSARRAEKLDTEHRFPQVFHLLGVILANRRDFTGAAVEMRDYLQFAPEAKDAAAVRSQLAAFEKESAAVAAVPQP